MSDVMWQPGVTIADLEKGAIKSALRFYGNKTDAAKSLGISVRTIDNKLKEYENQKIASEQAAKIAREKKLAEFRGLSVGTDNEKEVILPRGDAEQKTPNPQSDADEYKK
ncbi:putative sigma-54-dependent transcriptional regulator [Bdellovibrio phage phi1422]|uniref:putative sigma-54-dependent transcriptional regulator n=1 Tax=Bdellovibrio phage phi1422 TaxID=1127515 RepID=UPI0002536D62|nr:putative sigma-54-dependent transcriptional regulator [Bdellovibrio phage phi1422]AFC22566.1 putative sigma-54-dependent transcriptional regulator [Bdellovibrio phage phi1422]